jgi:uncharacterized metal-binding protein
MNPTLYQYNKVHIFPCGGNSSVGQLTVLASQELILEGKGEWVYSTRIKDLQKLGNGAIDSSPFIVVDGCEKQCGRKYLEQSAYDFEFHLSLEDLGIENLGNSDFEEDDDVQLVKDAIIAESTRVTEQPPAILGGCGCLSI